MLTLIVAGEATFGLPFIVIRLFRPALLDVFGITNLQLGSAFALYGLLAMLSYLLGGPLADRYSARKLMSIALLGTAVGGVVYFQIPSIGTLTLLFGYWGITTILLFWSPLIRATRSWGGVDAQGRAFGILDGGRGLFAAVLGVVTLALFSALMPEDIPNATLAERAAALQSVIAVFTVFTVLAGALVWFVLPDTARQDSGPGSSAREVWANVMMVARNRAVWLQMLIVLTAYCGYKAMDDYSLYARDGFGFDDLQSGKVGAVAMWVRPVAAVAAGLLGDRVGISRMVVACFGVSTIGFAAMGVGAAGLGLPTMLFLMVITTATVVFGLRGLYFALFRAAKVDPALTGTAAGIISVLGYTPDIFIGPLNGILTDSFPGAAGHEYFYASVAVFMALGWLCAWLFQREAART